MTVPTRDPRKGTYNNPNHVPNAPKAPKFDFYDIPVYASDVVVMTPQGRSTKRGALIGYTKCTYSAAAKIALGAVHYTARGGQRCWVKY